MENNREVKIAIIVGIIMITICLLAFIYYKASTNVEEINIKVYKNYTTEEGRAYYECSISTEDLLTVNNEYKRITNLRNTTSITGGSIKGTYMISTGDEYIAFDAEDNNYVYVLANGKQAIYDISSTAYDIVKKACSVMDSEFLETDTEETEEAS